MFIELLFVMGIMGMLTAIVLVAINPKKHLCEASNARRHITARELANAVNQYEIRTHRKVISGELPVSEVNAKPVCRFGISNDPTCLNLDVLVPEYLVRFPQDDTETNPHYAGYSMYRMAAGLDLVAPDHLEDCNN